MPHILPQRASGASEMRLVHWIVSLAHCGLSELLKLVIINILYLLNSGIF